MAKKAVAIAFGFAFGLMLVAIAEVSLRLLPPAASPAIAGHIGIQDRETGWRLRPGYDGAGPDLPDVRLSYRVHVNAAGFRGAELPLNKAPDEIRIAALGDSVTFGFGVGDDETFVVRVAAVLARELPLARVEAINAGVPGFTSLQGRRYLPRVLAYQPDVLLVLYGWNDGWRTTEPYATRASFLRTVEQSSALFTAGQRLAAALRSPVAAGATRAGAGQTFPYVPPEAFAANLSGIARMARQAGARPVLLTAPAAFGPTLPPDRYFRAVWMVPRAQLEPTRQRYADAVRAVAAVYGIPLVDCARLIPRNPDLFLADGYHPNGEGQRAIADAIAATLHESGVVADLQQHLDREVAYERW